MNHNCQKLMEQLKIVEEPLKQNTQIKTGDEISIPVPWGHIAGKEWGTVGGEPVLAYHGMQDNCCTFDLMAPLIPSKYHFVAVDFPGYGKSSPYPINTFASPLDSVVDFQRILRHFGWSKVVLIGHSYGGAMAIYIAATCPEMIIKFIGIETAKPISTSSSKSPEVMRTRADIMLSISDKLMSKFPSKERSYTIEEAIKVMTGRMNKSLNETSARILLDRSVTVVDPVQNLVKFNFDPKNLLMMHAQFCEEETVHFAKSLGRNMDNLFIAAEDGRLPDWAWDRDSFRIPKYLQIVAEFERSTQVRVKGNHHVHLNNPERVVPLVLEFLETSRINPDVKREEFLEILVQPSNFLQKD